ncbi:type I-E CRISPR-associated protein Cas7/Cse4/CasC [Olegusella massiliensis]|uniref:type I-E CRISPR-associated protein Cas7/Cse4/CasC n=1 Tax=Olegusella massiliensis TaxID=1776381 RepID=UPI0023F6E235|nr:type I-E CRISPR-associated protein Cas7/Cse4/CasC [Olegusella massiliensis]
MLNDKPLYIDIHILQSVPPCNINRDDTGSPKTARLGGINRSRVSSQAWKKATRDLFPYLLNREKVGFRTQYAVSLIAKKAASLSEGVSEEKILEKSKEILKNYFKKGSNSIGFEKDASTTKTLIFISNAEIAQLAECVLGRKDLKSLQGDLAKDAVDIAMFGRMVAEAPNRNVDASVQVAHAIGVSRVMPEFDYFTALDDCAPSDNAGAAHLDTTEFSSATLYRYANIDVRHLCENLNSATAALEGISCFINAFTTSMPTGKQNSFANRTLPSAVVVQLRESQPVSLVNAFERAIVPRRGESQTELACKALVKQEQALEKAFDVLPQHTYTVCGAPDASAIEELSNGDSISLDALIVSVKKECQAYLASCGYVTEAKE